MCTGALSQWNQQSPAAIPASSARKSSRTCPGFHDVIGVHFDPPGQVRGWWRWGPWNWKAKTVSFPHAGLHLALWGQAGPFPATVVLLLGLGCVEGHHGLIHSDNLVKHRHGVAADHCQESLSLPHVLHLWLLFEKLGAHLANFFERFRSSSRVVVIALSTRHRPEPVFWWWHACHWQHWWWHRWWKSDPASLVGCRFPFLHLPNYLVKLCFLQGLVAVDIFNRGVLNI